MYGAMLLVSRFKIIGISRLSCTGGFSQDIILCSPNVLNLFCHTPDRCIAQVLKLT